MVNFIKTNSHFLLLLLIWLISGFYGGPLYYVVIPGSVLLMHRKGMDKEILLGFLFTLIMSDSRNARMSFFIEIKDYYIVLLSLFVIFNFKKFAPFKKIYVIFIPFFIVAFASLIFNSEPDYFFRGFQKTLSYLLLLMVIPSYVVKIYKVLSTDFFRDWIFFISLLLATGIVLKFLSPGYVISNGRFTSLLGNPNGLGLFCLMFYIMFTVVLTYYPELFTGREKILVFFLVFISVYMAGSRSTIFAILIFHLFKYFYKMSGFLGFIVFLTVLVSYEFITDNLGSIIISLGLGNYFRVETLSQGSGRLVVWALAWKEIQYNFFFGRGFAYNEYLTEKFYDFLSIRGHNGNVHNSYLTFWLDTGLVGVILYFGALIFTFLKGIKNSRLTMPILYSVLFSISFESWLTASLNPFTIQLLIILTIITGNEFIQSRSSETNEESLIPVH